MKQVDKKKIIDEMNGVIRELYFQQARAIGTAVGEKIGYIISNLTYIRDRFAKKKPEEYTPKYLRAVKQAFIGAKNDVERIFEFKIPEPVVNAFKRAIRTIDNAIKTVERSVGVLSIGVPLLIGGVILGLTIFFLSGRFEKFLPKPLEYKP